MIQIYADGVLTYDSRLEEYDLLGLKITAGLNKGGTAEIRMPASHPTYNSYTPYRTIVEVYRDSELRFRGRALYPAEDFTNARTITCEGELCFLQDYTLDPYQHTTTPRKLFENVVARYNSAVEPWKQLKLGTINAPNVDVEMALDSEEPETALDTVTKLRDGCGGFFVFTTDSNGDRCIHWLASVGRDSQQEIDAENLLDFGRSGANTELCTVVRPYGAKDPDTGKRLSIVTVNGGRDTVKDEAAVTRFGTIMKAPVWDEVTDPAALKALAEQYLDDHKSIVTSLTVSALDLSFIDKRIDSFRLGDTVRAISKPHGLDERFQISDLTEDLLNPAQSTLTLGKEIRTLTGLDVAGDTDTKRGLLRAVSAVKRGYTATASQAAADLEARLEPVIRNIQNRLDILELPTDDGVDNV